MNEPTYKWGGHAAHLSKGTLHEMYEEIPVFKRIPFSLGGMSNRYYDLIVRPDDDNVPPVPVGVVSKKYRLIQHRELVNRIVEGMDEMRLGPDKAEAELCLTDYGARMRLRVLFPDHSLDPGDGHGVSMRLVCYNSVDGSGPLEIFTEWFRLVCSNGMAWEAEDRYRRIHNVHYLSLESVAAHLDKTMDQLKTQEENLKKMMNRKVDDTTLALWADRWVTEFWGVQKAARVLHICRTGLDAKAVPPPVATKLRASEYEVTPLDAVPGAPKGADNAYHVCQALTWLVRNSKNIGDEWQMTKDVSRLMAKLGQMG